MLLRAEKLVGAAAAEELAGTADEDVEDDWNLRCAQQAMQKRSEISTGGLELSSPLYIKTNCRCRSYLQTWSDNPTIPSTRSLVSASLLAGVLDPW